MNGPGCLLGSGECMLKQLCLACAQFLPQPPPWGLRFFSSALWPGAPPGPGCARVLIQGLVIEFSLDTIRAND